MIPDRPGHVPPGSAGPPGPRAGSAPPRARSRRWRRIVVAGLGILSVGGAVAGWWWFQSAPVDPPFPTEINDPDVRGKLEEARQEVRANPRSASAWGRLGMTLQVHAFGTEADRCFAEATRLDPDDGHWPYYRALNAQREDPDRALPFLRQAAAGRLPTEHESAVRLRLAEVLLERQELAEAEPLFLAAWAGRPGDPRAGFGLGLIALARGDGAAAEKYLTAARASPVVRKPASAQLAALARDRGDAAAAAALEKEVAALPDDPPAWPDPMVLEMTRLRVGAYKEMLDTAQLEMQHRHAEAAKVYLRKIDQTPAAENYVGAGLNLVRSGNVPLGLSLLRKGISINPDRCESHYGLAMALYLSAAQERGRSPDSRAAGDLFLEAAAAARRATELKPDYAEAFLLWGGALMGRGETAAAILPFKKGVACRPEMFSLQLALGQALMETGQLDEAEIHLKNAMKLDPMNEQPGKALERLRKQR